MNPALLSLAIAAALAMALLAIYFTGHQVSPLDVTIGDGVQSTSWAFLALTFPVFSFIGDAKGAVLEAVIFIAILIFNRKTWIFAAGAFGSAAWYILLSHFIVRAVPARHLCCT